MFHPEPLQTHFGEKHYYRRYQVIVHYIIRTEALRSSEFQLIFRAEGN